MALITLIEYARRHGKAADSVRHKAERGGYQTAVKFGRDWAIDESEPDIDRRITHGKTIGYRKRKAQKPE